MGNRPEQLAREAIADITRFQPHLTTVIDSLEEWLGVGYGKGGGSGRSTGINRPTEQAAATIVDNERRYPNFRRDTFATDHAELAELATIMAGAAHKMAIIVDRNRALPRDPKTGKVVVAPGEGCHPCGLVKDPSTGKDHPNGYQDIYVRRTRPANPEGPKVGYCHWHVRFIERYEEEPNADVVLYHLEHANVTSRVIRELQPEAFQRGQAKQQRVRPLALSRLELGETG